MNTAQLRQKILDLAIHGKLVDSGKLTVDSAVVRPVETTRHCEERSDEAILYNCHADSELLRNSSAVGEPVETTRHCEKRSDEAIPYNCHADSELLRNSSAVGEPVETTRHCEKQSDEAISSVPEDEQPFELPRGWKWCRLPELCEIPITDGTHKTPTYTDKENGVPFLSSKDVTSQKINWENIKYITKDLHKELYKRVSPKKNDILLAKNGTTGVAAIVEEDKIFDIYVTLALIRPNCEKVVPKYLLLIINSKFCKNQFNEHLIGIGVPNLHLNDINKTLIPLPPLAEQKQIVAKIEQIFSQIDILEQNKSTLLLSVKQAKRKILDLAIHGKLVDSGKLTVDSAVIRPVETTRHVEQSETSIPKEKSHGLDFANAKSETQNAGKSLDFPNPCGNIPEEEQPFELPQGWKWCRLGEIAETIPTKKYQILEKEIKTAGKYPVISQSGNYIEGYTNNESAVLRIDGNSLVVFGDHTRNVKYVDFDFVVGADGVKLLKPKDIFPKYLYYEILYSSIKIENRGYGRHFQFINKVLYPLPPLAEQKQIVAKIEQLFSMLDKIQAAAE